MTDPAIAAVGPRVKALREAEGLSLRDLAVRSGVSAPMLSQVERGETSPTLQVAERIAAGLELRLSQLLRLDESGDGQRSCAPASAAPAAPAATATRCSRRRCPASAPRSRRHALEPGAATGGPGDPPMHEPGARETAVVEPARVRLLIDGAAHALARRRLRDVRRRPAAPFREPGKEAAVLLAVVSAGLRRS